MSADLEEKENLVMVDRSIPSGNTITNSKRKSKNKIIESIDLINIIIRISCLMDYLVLFLFIISLGFLLNDLKEAVTRSFVLIIVITLCFTFFFQAMIIIIAYSRNNLKRYIEEYQQAFKDILPKYFAYINDIVIINLLYLPSLINYFLLQTPDIFNKIFLNLSALFVSSWIVLMYKSILKNEGMKEEGEEPETTEEFNEEMEGEKELDLEKV
ncbi:hypothetical protein RclHR1_07250001 [Rhizophagus clarus]|nr:hypothetical protein RclHR1_07250001 [Rhizophagus clarus]